MQKHTATQARKIIKITVTQTVKIEIIDARAETKKAACSCCNNCKR